MRWIAILSLLLAALAGPVAAQGLSALARLDPERSGIETEFDGWTTLTLTISQPVPFRVHTLADPARLVLDFREVEFGALSTEMLGDSTSITGLRHGPFQAGWSRLVLDLAGPLAVDQAGMTTGAADGSARISVVLTPVDAEVFAELSGAPLSRAFPQPDKVQRPATRPNDDGRFTIVLDPGHGGIDPGAIHGGVNEADLMLTFARELKEILVRSGEYEVILTRNSDEFVSLESRISIARRAHADLFLSLHADAVTEGVARGAQIYTLSDSASSRAAKLLAERHDRGELLAGVDLSQQDDRVARVLMSMARTETAPRSRALAAALAEGLDEAGIRLHKRPLEEGGFSVLKAPDLPSALVEIGFMSSPGELEKLQSADWRAKAAQGLTAGVAAWQEADAVHRSLIRQ